MVEQPPHVSVELLFLVGGSSGLRPGRGVGKNGAGAPRRPGGAAAGVWVRTAFPAALPRPGSPPPAAGRPGRPLPRALLLPHPPVGLQSQETASAQLEGAVELTAPRRRQPVSRVAGRGTKGKGGAPLPRGTGGRRAWSEGAARSLSSEGECHCDVVSFFLLEGGGGWSLKTWCSGSGDLYEDQG